MKIGGKKPSSPKPELIVIPREDDDIIFQAAAVLDDTEFDNLCPAPIPPIVTKRGGAQFKDTDDRKYLEKIVQHSKKRFAWLILKSLEATPDLVWETVDMKNPDTWGLYEEELRATGFVQAEVNRIIQGVMDANAMNDEKIKQAKDRFLRSQVEDKSSISPQGEQ